MDKFQATFEVLYILGVIDHQLHSKEVDVINSYINQNLGKSNYDTHATMNSLNTLSFDGRIQELGLVARFLDSICSAQDKINILDFALRVVLADTRLTDDETTAFVLIGQTWNIDVSKFTHDRLG
jgi:hypothetical protein